MPTAQPAASSQPLESKPQTVTESIDSTVDESHANELVIALVAPMGSATPIVAKGIVDYLKSDGTHFDEYEIVKISHLLDNGAPTGENKVDRKFRLQAAGNELRKEDVRLVATKAIQKIQQLRKAGAPGTRHVFVVDSIKHPAELELFRQIYGKTLFVISLQASCDIRREILKKEADCDSGDAVAMARIDELMRIDQDEDLPYGQLVSECFYLADYFLSIGKDVEAGNLKHSKQFKRMMSALCGDSLVRPQPEEYAMHAAWSASFRSACLSRQVGASILDAKRKHLLATGANEVPRFGGGQYDGDDGSYRCFLYGIGGPGYCRNTRKINKSAEELFESLQQAGLLTERGDFAAFQNAFKSTRFARLIEFSRALHAEQAAILGAATTESGGLLRGAILFSTTFPCHSCIKHLVAAGIQTVHYIEPYTKSLALDLHPDAVEMIEVIADRSKDDGGSPTKLALVPYSGVGPAWFKALFEKTADLKDTNGNFTPKGGALIPKRPVVTVVELEKKLIAAVYDADSIGDTGKSA
ncbi:MAG: hypothetical protein AB7K24_12320 [Gemmataceae bacterium]